MGNKAAGLWQQAFQVLIRAGDWGGGKDAVCLPLLRPGVSGLRQALGAGWLDMEMAAAHLR